MSDRGSDPGGRTRTGTPVAERARPRPALGDPSQHGDRRVPSALALGSGSPAAGERGFRVRGNVGPGRRSSRFSSLPATAACRWPVARGNRRPDRAVGPRAGASTGGRGRARVGAGIDPGHRDWHRATDGGGRAPLLRPSVALSPGNPGDGGGRESGTRRAGGGHSAALDRRPVAPLSVGAGAVAPDDETARGRRGGARHPQRLGARHRSRPARIDVQQSGPDFDCPAANGRGAPCRLAFAISTRARPPYRELRVRRRHLDAGRAPAGATSPLLLTSSPRATTCRAGLDRRAWALPRNRGHLSRGARR